MLSSTVNTLFALSAAFASSVLASPIGGRDQDASTAGFRYLTNKTAPYRVKSLPDVPFDLGEFYSGEVPIDIKNPNRTLFFAFKPAINGPANSVTIWQTGGPGCSSLLGFSQENGPWEWEPGQPSFTYNPYTWANITNVLWVESPVGVGFSKGNPAPLTSEEQVAQDFVGFFKNWEQLFGIQNYEIYVTGESYAGRYVPYISSAMLNQNDTKYFNLSGNIIYDPVIGDLSYQEEAGIFPLVVDNKLNLGFNQSVIDDLNKTDVACGYADARNKYLHYPPAGKQAPAKALTGGSNKCSIWFRVNNLAYYTNPCFNIYEVSQQCPAPYDSIAGSGSGPGAAQGNPYFNRSDVKAALHAPANVNWGECANHVLDKDTSALSIEKAIPQVIKATNRVLISNGNLDAILPTAGTLLAIQNMTWNGQLGFQKKPSTPVYVAKQPNQLAVQAGVSHFEKGLMWMETWQSGHMQPQFQPAVSFRHVQWMLRQIDTL